MSLVEIKNLTKRFGDNLIWENVNESIEKGDVIVIVGNSGCGKTTFLRCINMLETPSSGQIFIDGDEITAVGADIDKIRSKMGMVYQNFNLFSHLTVLENIIKAPMVVNKIPKEQAIKEGMEYLRMVGMQERADFMPDQLSGGQKQRVAIIRALCMNPEFDYVEFKIGVKVSNDTPEIVPTFNYYTLNTYSGNGTVSNEFAAKLQSLATERGDCIALIEMDEKKYKNHFQFYVAEK